MKLRFVTFAALLAASFALVASAGAAVIGPWPVATTYTWEDQPILNYVSGAVWVDSLLDQMFMPGPTTVKKTEWLGYPSPWAEKMAMAKLILDPGTALTTVHARVYDPLGTTGKSGWAVILIDSAGRKLDFGIRGYYAAKKIVPHQYDGATWVNYDGTNWSPWVSRTPAGGNYYAMDFAKNADDTLQYTLLAIEWLPDLADWNIWSWTGQTTVKYDDIAELYLSTSTPDTSGPVNYKWTEFNYGTADHLSTVRGLGSGDVDVYGVVTLVDPSVTPGFIYIEAQDRTVGIRVNVDPGLIAAGDVVEVSGTIGFQNGEKVINAGTVTVLSSGTVLPAPFDLRTRAVGGAAYGPNDPGVTNGRGALNVGLRVKVEGLVTALDPGGTYFYVWDGANRVDSPLDDGTGNKGVRIAHDGVIEFVTVVPWRDWVEVVGVVSATDQVVGGKVIPVIIPTLPPTDWVNPYRVTVFDAIHADAGTALTAGWNLIGLPAAPAATGTGSPPEQYGYEAPWEPQRVLAPGKTYEEVDARVTRFENANQSSYMYDMWSEPLGPFGGMLLGDGYWVKLDSAWAVNYSGKNSALDQWYSIKTAPGWILLGHPKDHYTYWDDAKMHDGAQIVTMEQASTHPGMLGWIDTLGLWFDNSTQSLKEIGVTEDWPAPGNETLRPWHGYWFKVKVPGKSIIFPEAPEAPTPP